MRIGTRSNDPFMIKLNDQNNLIIDKFKDKMAQICKIHSIQVMLADNTITQQNTFDPNLIEDYFKTVTSNLNQWSVQETMKTHDKDIRRIFAKFQNKQDNCILSCHLSIQFHVLLYYKPDNLVSEYQKQLEKIVSDIGNSEEKYAETSNKIIEDELRKISINQAQPDELFEILYKNDSMRDNIQDKIKKQTDTKLDNLINKRKQILNELDKLLIEAYQGTSILIDENRLVTGEEGILYTLDLEMIKDEQKQNYVDVKEIKKNTQEQLEYRLKEIYDALK